MANKLAVYKQPYFLSSFDYWWGQETAAGNHFRTADEMFVSYINHQLDVEEYEAIVGYDDFQKLAYKQGVRRLGDGSFDEYVRLPNWRPSDDQTMRLATTRMAV